MILSKFYRIFPKLSGEGPSQEHYHVFRFHPRLGFRLRFSSVSRPRFGFVQLPLGDLHRFGSRYKFTDSPLLSTTYQICLYKKSQPVVFTLLRFCIMRLKFRCRDVTFIGYYCRKQSIECITYDLCVIQVRGAVFFTPQTANLLITLQPGKRLH